MAGREYKPSDSLLLVSKILTQLRNDDRFHEDLAKPAVRSAVKHWTGENRLPPEETDEWENDPCMLAMLRRVRELSHACQEAGIPVPMGLVRARGDVLQMGIHKLQDGAYIGSVEPQDLDEPGEYGASTTVSWQKLLISQLLMMAIMLGALKIGALTGALPPYTPGLVNMTNLSQATSSPSSGRAEEADIRGQPDGRGSLGGRAEVEERTEASSGVEAAGSAHPAGAPRDEEL